VCHCRKTLVHSQFCWKIPGAYGELFLYGSHKRRGVRDGAHAQRNPSLAAAVGVPWPTHRTPPHPLCSAGRSFLADALQLCPDAVLKTDEDVLVLREWLAGAWDYMVGWYDREEREERIRQ
jgi:hypothetical protein